MSYRPELSGGDSAYVASDDKVEGGKVIVEGVSAKEDVASQCGPMAVQAEVAEDDPSIQAWDNEGGRAV